MTKNKSSLLGRIWAVIKKPTAKYSMATLLTGGFVAGIIFWGGFNTAMEMTNTEQFCISCHEMRNNVYEEYKDTIHYANRTGVRATCPDCHVPKEWNHKIVRKIQASNELLHKALGSIDTREKYEAKRLQLAQNVWKSMKATDSRECRNCHDYDSMDFVAQGRRAIKQHSEGLESGKTCIDCHKGVAHELPDMRDVDASAVVGAN
ncbi:MAG: cytochrome c-type protein NapC [Gammaproteobacteria bacterium]|nr:cytochrome c-type protein NapC [Gammaproteobacteria bacterium]